MSGGLYRLLPAFLLWKTAHQMVVHLHLLIYLKPIGES